MSTMTTTEVPMSFEVIARADDGDRWLVLQAGEEQARVVTLSRSEVSPPIADDLILELAQWEPAFEAPIDLMSYITAAAANPKAEAPPITPDGKQTFKILIVDEAKTTDDGRTFEKGGLSWREPPFPVMFKTVNTPGHEGSELGGTVREAWRGHEDGTTDPESTQIWGRGDYVPFAEGDKLDTLVDGGYLTGNSADIADADVEVTLAEDSDRPSQHVRSGVIIGTTVLPFPAFGNTRIANEEAVAASGFTVNLVASSAPEEDCIPCRPPAEWFANPNLQRPTSLTVTDEGRVFGHLATWGTCHTGHPGRCLTPPHSRSEYAYFRTGAVHTREGTVIATGPITLGTGHASTARHIGAQAAAAHYDNTGTAVCDVVCGEDAVGIWMAGALRPNTSPDTIRDLRCSAPSGDWREIGGNLELIAALAVNAPGFPVPRAKAELRGEEPIALVAAGVLVQDSTDSLLDRIARLEQAAHFSLEKVEDDEVSDPMGTHTTEGESENDEGINVRLDAAERMLLSLAKIAFREEHVMSFAEDQPRDDHGRFASGGGGGDSGSEGHGRVMTGNSEVDQHVANYLDAHARVQAYTGGPGGPAAGEARADKAAALQNLKEMGDAGNKQAALLSSPEGVKAMNGATREQAATENKYAGNYNSGQLAKFQDQLRSAGAAEVHPDNVKVGDTIHSTDEKGATTNMKVESVHDTASGKAFTGTDPRNGVKTIIQGGTIKEGTGPRGNYAPYQRGPGAVRVSNPYRGG